MPAQKIDFKHIRQNADIERVISHFGIELHKDGAKEDQYKVLCPFHDDTEPSMKVNTERNIYHCFVCDAGGNVLDFVSEHEGVELREAAKTVADICDIALAPDQRKSMTAKQEINTTESNRAKHNSNETGNCTSKKKGSTSRQSISSRSEVELDGIPYNKVLTFELKNLVTDHPFIATRKLSPETIDTFGLGIATRGIMKDRLAIPIHNKVGGLVAYCGRYVGDDIPEDEPKYKHPKGFCKEIEMFNWHRAIKLNSSPMILVESFFSVFMLHAMGLLCVSPMGRTLSKAQIALLKESGVKKVVLLFDGDDLGRQATITVGRDLLKAGLKVSVPVVPEDFKPHRLSHRKLKRIIKWRK